MNFTVTLKGEEYSRLGLMFLGDTEVFRTSTAEPTTNGTMWTYIKEMEQYSVLWRTDQKIIFDFGNFYGPFYTGSYNATLTATFFTVPNSRPTADQILPISAQASAGDSPSAFSLPTDIAIVNHKISQNAERAVVSLSACGELYEKSWYMNAFNSQTRTFENATGGFLGGYSPFREVQLIIDGQLAGVSWPFPVMSASNLAPGLWRPIAGINAFDLREHEIDITPWLPNLCDGAEHSFEIRVAGIDDDGHDKASLTETVDSSWIVTGKIFLFFGPEGSITSGTPPRVDTPPPNLQINSSITTNATGANETLRYGLSASRSISITSEIKTSNGSSFPASWTQRIQHTSVSILSSQGFVQTTKHFTNGEDSSATGYRSLYNQPLTVTSTYIIDEREDFIVNASLSRALDIRIIGPAVFPSAVQSFSQMIFSPPAFFALAGHQQLVPVIASGPLPLFSGARTTTTETGEGTYMNPGMSATGNRSYDFGTMSQEYSFAGLRGAGDGTEFELYRRDLKAVNTSLDVDVEALLGKRVGPSALLSADTGPVVQEEASKRSVWELLGRGPGRERGDLVGFRGQKGKAEGPTA
ncbi:MAG: hypothetical protein Q9201_006908 [Fulgogasparrea decipioides]